MTKNYQIKKSKQDNGAQVVVPETVNVAMAEIAQDMREGLLAVAVRTGLQVMQVMMEADVTARCGPKGKHDADRSAVRHGSEKGSVALGGRQVPIRRPRVRTVDGTAELAIPTYELFASTEIMSTMALERMIAGLSARRYGVGLEPVGARVEEKWLFIIEGGEAVVLLSGRGRGLLIMDVSLLPIRKTPTCMTLPMQPASTVLI